MQQEQVRVIVTGFFIIRKDERGVSGYNQCYRFAIIILNISPWAYIREGLYSNGFFVNKSLGLYSRGLIIEGAYTRDFTVYKGFSNVELTLRDFHTFYNM